MVSPSRTPSGTVSQISQAVKTMSNVSNSDGDDHRESLSDTISFSHWKDHKNHRCALFQGKTSKILARFTAEIKNYFKVKQRLYDKCPRRELIRYESAPLSGGAVLALLVWPEDFQLYCHCRDSCKSITLALKDTRTPAQGWEVYFPLRMQPEHYFPTDLENRLPSWEGSAYSRLRCRRGLKPF